MRGRVLPLVAMVLCARVGEVAAGMQANIEDRINDARAKPVTIASEGAWAVVPVPVSDPTVGTGLQVGVLYLHPKNAADGDAPAATSGIGAMKTNAGARLVGAFHDGSFDNDRYRVSGFGGTGRFELKYYGVGNGNETGGRALPYEMKGTLAQLSASMRLPNSKDWYVGITYQYLDATLTFLTSQLVPGLPDVPISFRNVGLGPTLSYDSRDSNYFPTRGQLFKARVLKYSPRWSSSAEFEKGDVSFSAYVPIGPASVVALRGHLQTASGGTPFYQMPTLDTRGFSRDRYRDHYAASLTSEWRHRLTDRWGVTAFAEGGRVAPSIGDLGSAKTVVSYGAGARWRVSADRDLNIGLDFAISTDDRALFIQIGERF